MKEEKYIKEMFSQLEGLYKTSVHGEDNPHISAILFLISSMACYLKSKGQAIAFKDCWTSEIQEPLKNVDFAEWQQNWLAIKTHIEQSLAEESVHNPSDRRNKGIAWFYEHQFPKLFRQAKELCQKEEESLQAEVKAMQDKQKEYDADHSKWEEDLRNGNLSAFAD